MPAVLITKQHWKEALTKHGKEAAAYVAKDPASLAITFDMIKEVIERNYPEAAASLLGVMDAKSSNYALSPQVKTGLKVTATLVSVEKLTMGLRALNDVERYRKLSSPAGVVTLVGASTVAKMGILLNLAGEDEKKAKCIGALMEVGGNVGVTVVTFESGIGAVMGVASIALSSVNAYNECKGVSFK